MDELLCLEFAVTTRQRDTNVFCVQYNYNYFTCYILWNLVIKLYSILVHFMNLPSKYTIYIYFLDENERFKRTNYLQT